MPTLFEPIQVGALPLRNRIIMAPLTRCRCGPDRVPNALMADYYRQRSGAGLILTEATSIDPMGVGYPGTPGIWSREQVAGWQQVTAAVHAQGGTILLQLWHVGRLSDPVYLDGKLPVAPSAIAAPGHPSLIRPTHPFVTPRALELKEIPAIIETYRQGAKNAQEAGFDGVEIHGANGYLPDQFLQDNSNQRHDAYGGSIENRARFMFEAVDAAVSVWGADRVGLHLAPRANAQGMGDSNPPATFTHVAKMAAQRQLAFLCARESMEPPHLGSELKKIFGGVYIANEKFTKESAEALLTRGEADAVAFGKLYIANPDLVRRFELNAPLNEPNPETFYSSGPRGYNDYPALAA